METKIDKNILVKGDKFIDPVYVIAQMEILPGSTIVDFGCGAGYFSLPLSQAVGKEGKIYSLDILPQALESVESQAKIAGITNILTRRANLENEKGSGLEENIADWVIIKDMLYQNQKKEIILDEARRILRPEGKILVVEWNTNNFSIGPDKKVRISTEDLMEIVKKQKFNLEKVIKAGNFHYAMIISK